MSEASELKPLLEALSWFDEDSKLARARRIEWASSLYQSSGLVSGEIVPLSLMEEARACFVNGQFMATVLCATSVIEHLLVDELDARGVTNGKSTLGPSIGVARDAQIFPAALLERVETLNSLRNPIAHRRGEQDASSLATRYRRHQVHPSALLESDARFSLEVMYAFFLLVLKPSA
jgi:hypothetical protein